MRQRKVFNRLQFNNDLVFYHDVGNKIPDNFTFVKNFDGLLRDSLHSGAFEFFEQASFVYRLQVPETPFDYDRNMRIR